MTRPQAPRPYPGDAGAQPARPLAVTQQTRPPHRREYKDALGRPMNGYASIRAQDDSTIRVPIVDGVLEVELAPGRYRIIAEVAPDDGQVQYITTMTSIARYW